MKTRSLRLRLVFRLGALGLALLAASPAAAQDSAAATVRALLASARHPWARWPDFPRYVDVAGRLYGARRNTLLWVGASGPSPAARSVVAELLAAPARGLDALDYDAGTLDSLLRRVSQPPGAADRARLDVLLTVNLLRYLDDVHRGRLREHPLSGEPRPPDPDPAALVRGIIGGDVPSSVVEALEPAFGQYRSLLVALARYRTLAADTALGLDRPVAPPPGGALRPGDAYASAEALGTRLAALGDLATGTKVPSGRYAGALVEAVRRFQQRHALVPDGVIGRATLEALRVPPSARVRQIELALERLRWVPPIGGGRFLVVNVPAFQLVALDSAASPGPPALSMRVVVGRALDTRTPMLVEELRYVEFRPAWNVPRSITVKELLPILRRRPGYLRSQAMELVGPGDRVMGDDVTPAALAGLARGALRVRQRPGPQNALGLAKFVFPNAASVYMHGTPAPELFAHTRRDFSHGCIRVEDPAGLAAWVLADRSGWTLQQVEAAMAGPATTRVLLSRPMPVLLYYTTAVAHADGSVWFYPDVYGHDRDLVEALRAGPGPP